MMQQDKLEQLKGLVMVEVVVKSFIVIIMLSTTQLKVIYRHRPKEQMHRLIGVVNH